VPLLTLLRLPLKLVPLPPLPPQQEMLPVVPPQPVLLPLKLPPLPPVLQPPLVPLPPLPPLQEMPLLRPCLISVEWLTDLNNSDQHSLDSVDLNIIWANPIPRHLVCTLPVALVMSISEDSSTISKKLLMAANRLHYKTTTKNIILLF
jgi:hypothetical protein